MLDVQNVIKHYRAGSDDPVRAVDDVSLSVDRGELVALYGPSGSGKTTLLKLIAAVIQPDRGTISFAGRDIGSLSDREASRYRLHELGFVLQSFHLIAGLSAIDNAAVKLMATGQRPRDAHRQVTPLLERLGIDDRADHRASELSVGEQQRVVIARALSTAPHLVLADEPTASLDTRRGHTVLTLLAEVCRERGTAVLIVTHDPQVAAFADRVLVMRDGRVVDADHALATSPHTLADLELER
jgi:putative ABC transport system ATP-binding protein